MKTLNANGTKLAYESFGEEAAGAIVLISGLGTQMIRWRSSFCRFLAKQGYRVIRFDNRDTGQSADFAHLGSPDFSSLMPQLMAGNRPDVPYTLAEMANDTIGLLDALSIGQAHIVGRSMGGMIAQILASEHPARVLSLTSIMSGTGNPAMPSAAPDVMALMMRPAPDPASDEADYLSHSIAFARRIAGTAYPFDEEDYRTLIRREIRRGYAPGGFGRQLAAMAVAGDRRARLASIQAPALIIHGTDDPLIPPACGEDTAAAIPGASLMLIEGMGHDLPPQLYETVALAICQVARQAIEPAITAPRIH